MVDFSLVEDEVLKEGFLEMILKRIDFLTGRPGTIKSTQHTIDEKEQTRPIHEQTNRSRQQSREKLFEHI